MDFQIPYSFCSSRNWFFIYASGCTSTVLFESRKQARVGHTYFNSAARDALKFTPRSSWSVQCSTDVLALSENQLFSFLKRAASLEGKNWDVRFAEGLLWNSKGRTFALLHTVWVITTSLCRTRRHIYNIYVRIFKSSAKVRGENLLG